jgi:hypothetical protein
MRLCVGATSLRVIEEAAKLNVTQIIASRRQVDIDGGYTGLTQGELVDIVRYHSFSTKIVRDHGGPNQSGKGDDGFASFDADIEAGFDILHVDVTAATYDSWASTLRAQMAILQCYHDANVMFDIGGEHISQDHNDDLLATAFVVVDTDRIAAAVVSIGTLVRNDRQCGTPISVNLLRRYARFAYDNDIALKAHNMDWVGNRNRFDDVLDYYNLAPELALVETEALLDVLDFDITRELLDRAYAAGHWKRWFDTQQNGLYVGSKYDHAKCGVRYILNEPEVKEICTLDTPREEYVRSVIRAAIRAG